MAGPIDKIITFAGAGEQNVPAVGRYIRVLEADSDVYLGINNDTPDLKRRQGAEVSSDEGFRTIRVKSLIAQTIRLGISSVPQSDDSQSFTVSATADITPANALANITEVTVPAGGTAQLIASDATRQAVRIAIPDDQPNGIYWAASGLAADEGGWLGVGMVEVAAVSAEITARNRGAADVVVSIVPLKVI
ncbi:hypothetical protein [Zhongshania sp. BJYM1]|uniref:hypothetical protein n=1 Tax=Zhongshania aquatica TaxID=2965069 RepID=UPI0022B37E96|nr:hypothetical protein [Marortus sp. BJYM1]